jgi:hypothetical protein
VRAMLRRHTWSAHRDENRDQAPSHRGKSAPHHDTFPMIDSISLRL